ncbi:MAG: DUF3592 domain-containing protein [Defluviitaleaceae bacterium]|nr:DUF3592 domain-containing protein [Defluviitaleaceae bacterium]MCL2837212.1 DUF3592 domain-containing protein [Defluviitaleaceae bacterium]
MKTPGYEFARTFTFSGILMLFLYFFLNGSVVFVVLGLILAAAGLVLAFFEKRAKDKLGRLKREGESYAAVITDIKRGNLFMRTRSFVSFYAICAYHSKDGAAQSAKSGYFIIKRWDFESLPGRTAAPEIRKFNATVYVNPADPQDYAVEVVKIENDMLKQSE